MRVLFVADTRSPIAIGWMRHWVDRGHDVFVVSTFPGALALPVCRLFHVPVAFSTSRGAHAGRTLRSSRGAGLRGGVRHWLGPLTLRRSAARLRDIIRVVKPELVHALRIPYEGMLAALAVDGVPLVVSVWGNDFTLHAPATPLMGHFTRRTLDSAAALHADCERDVGMAARWGLRPGTPTLVSPGNGGIRCDVFRPSATGAGEPIVVNPRGVRAYVRNEPFFRAMPLVLARRPDARFACIGLADDAAARRWVEELDIARAVDLLPSLPHEEMAGVYRRAQVLVSPTVHDGTPNTVLEGMACGCFPVVGDLESLREWITNGVNGSLVDLGRPEQLAASIVRALDDGELRRRAAQRNAEVIASRAEYGACTARAERFYAEILASTGRRPAAVGIE